MKRSLGKKWSWLNKGFIIIIIIIIMREESLFCDKTIPKKNFWYYRAAMLTLPDIISYSSHGLIISNSSHIAQVSCRIIHAHDFQTCSFIHSFDECNQNRFSINNSHIENSVTVIKRQVTYLDGMKPSWDLTTQALITAHFFFSVFQALDSAFLSANLLWGQRGPSQWERHIWPLSRRSEDPHYVLH